MNEELSIELCHLTVGYSKKGVHLSQVHQQSNNTQPGVHLSQVYQQSNEAQRLVQLRQLHPLDYFLMLCSLRYCVGDMPRWLFVNLPKNERLGKPNNSDISLMERLERRRYFSIAFTV